ncbi:hypothetical protein T02_4367 [Trichinella nativa]|uniref:Uncharacterized protein n=1 Tax=Trichinella nativa TaxID=6335 RepID=A0A0V1LBP0_9BILA|nr:hypothetical protein T02_4367 [Trichinella nativa]
MTYNEASQQWIFKKREQDTTLENATRHQQLNIQKIDRFVVTLEILKSPLKSVEHKKMEQNLTNWQSNQKERE